MLILKTTLSDPHQNSSSPTRWEKNNKYQISSDGDLKFAKYFVDFAKKNKPITKQYISSFLH